MKKIIGYIFCALVISTPAYADEYSEKVKEILEISNTLQPAIDMADTILRQTATSTIDQMYSGFTDQGVNITRDDVVKLYNDYRIEFVAAFGENLTNIMVEPYKEHFTLEELDELLTLMKTPTYQKYATKTPELVEASQAAGERFGLQKGQEIMLRLIAENPKFN